MSFTRSLAICVSLMLASSLPGAPSDTAKEILSATQTEGGFIVHLGCGDGQLTTALRTNDRYQVHGLDRDESMVEAARAHVRENDVYGDVSIDQLRGDHLPYIDNLVNLIVAEDLGEVSMDEVMRVLTPNGVAYIKDGGKWTLKRKPRPDSIDEWTHYLHDASGNAVAHDDEVGPPRHLQWLGSPRWSRHHDRMASMSAMVSAGGLMFYIMDEGSRISIQMPPRWKLIARDAFNGTVQWKQDISTWHSHLWPLKSGPTQLARRLVATQDTVFCTLGIREPLTAIDAATGEILETYEETKPTEEVIYEGGTLFTLVNPGESDLTRYGPKLNTGDQGRVAREHRWNEKVRRIVALRPDGEVLWKVDSVVVPLTLAADSKRVFFHDGKKLVCLDRGTGEELWTSVPVDRRQRITFNFGPKLVIYGDVVLFAGGDRKMRGLDVETGKQIWESSHAQSGYQSPEDLLVAGGLVWNAPTTKTQDTGVFTGRDPLTGEAKIEFPPDVETYWFHHRCYIAKATDKFLLPSRTGIEFVDTSTKHWDINHWVRGGCLYGVMPCNGLVYAPPHNCACYPEAKLYGLNALAPEGTSRKIPAALKDKDRFVKGAAFDAEFTNRADAVNEWPTFRQNNFRSGAAVGSEVKGDLEKRWDTELGGDLTAPTIAGGLVYVAQPDEHTVHALDAKGGDIVWSFTTGARVDSPPTYYRGRVLFGSADGWVYNLRASDGALAWKFRGAPVDRRLMSFEQLESVWPIHGSVLVQNDEAWFVAGRSNFLDGGLRLFRLNAMSGEVISETQIDEKNPDTGGNLQERLQVLNMPVGLTDVLSSDGERVYMRSQEFDLEGNRVAVGPHSGTPSGQGSVQKGDTAHLFAPMGYLDDTWFHRAYWVYGRSFAGGHSGYHQAGKYAPSGRILVSDGENVYGFGRNPEYLKWTTTIEHQLFSSSKNPPKEALETWGGGTKSARRSGSSNMIRVAKSKSLDPTKRALSVEAWVNPASTKGVVVAHGGPSVGYSLWINGGRPQFSVRSGGDGLTTLTAKGRITGKWTHLVGVLEEDGSMKLYVNGTLRSEGKSGGLIPNDPAQGIELGADDGGPVAGYSTPNAIQAVIDEVRIFHGALSASEVAKRFDLPKSKPEGAKAVLSYSFDDDKATDASGNGNDGELDGVQKVDGIVGRGMRFRGSRGRSKGSFVQYKWRQDLPLLVRSMLKINDKLVIAGPPDIIDEESTFQRLVAGDATVNEKLAEQDRALDGEQGAILQLVSAKTGEKVGELKLDALPTWDGMATAYGQIMLTTADGRVLCYGGE